MRAFSRVRRVKGTGSVKLLITNHTLPTPPDSYIRALVVEVGATLLRLQIALDIAKGIHRAPQALSDQLIELDRLRQREVPAHLHRDLMAFQRGQVPGREVA